MQIHTIIRHNLTIFSVELEKVGGEAILKKNHHYYEYGNLVPFTQALV